MRIHARKPWWGARVRAAPLLAGATLLAACTAFGAGCALSIAGEAIFGIDTKATVTVTAIDSIVPIVYKGVASLIKAAKDKNFPPGTDGELIEPSEAHVNLSMVVPVAASNQINMDYLSSFIDASLQEGSFKNSQKPVRQIINFSGVSYPGESTLEQFYQKAGDGQVSHYLVVLMDESTDAAKTKPRELSDNDVESIILNRTFLYDKFASHVTEYKYGLTKFLIKNIKYHSGKINEEQLGGCVLYFMISNNIAKIAVVPFS